MEISFWDRIFLWVDNFLTNKNKKFYGEIYKHKFDGRVYATMNADEYSWSFLDDNVNFYYAIFDLDTLPTDSDCKSLLRSGDFFEATFEYEIIADGKRRIFPETFEIPDPNLEWLLKTLND